MNIGELFDTLQEKLNSGEINRMDTVYFGDDENWYAIDDIERKADCTVVIVSEDLTDDLMPAGLASFIAEEEDDG